MFNEVMANLSYQYGEGRWGAQKYGMSAWRANPTILFPPVNPALHSIGVPQMELTG